MDPDNDEFWGNFFFPGLSIGAQKFWLRFEEVADQVHYISVYFNYYLSFLGALFNIFHFIILIQKPMMTSSTNIIMIGICLCDLVMMSRISFDYIDTRIVLSHLTSPNSACFPPSSYFTVYLRSVFAFGSYGFKRCAVWLGVLLGGVRALVIRNPARTESLVTLKFGLLSTISTFLLASPLPILYLLNQRIKVISTWTPGPQCTGFPPNYSEPHVTMGQDPQFYTDNFQNLLITFDSWAYRIIPSVIFPIFTVFLVIELRKAKKRQMALRKSEVSDKTTRFVLWMTVTFVFAEAPQGIIALLLILSVGYQGFINILTEVTAIFLVADTVNSIIHVFICFFMSSQYRRTVRKLFGFKEKVVQPAWDVSSIRQKTLS